MYKIRVLCESKAEAMPAASVPSMADRKLKKAALFSCEKVFYFNIMRMCRKRFPFLRLSFLCIFFSDIVIAD